MHGHNISTLNDFECRQAVDRLALLKWLGSFSVGDDAVDAQHRRFFDLAAVVPLLVDSGAAAADMRAAVRMLCADTLHHFAEEEALLAEIAFPAFDRHRTAHQDMVQAFSNLAKDIGTLEDAHALGAIAHQMVMALLEHMLGEDMLYKSHLMRSRGL